MTPKEPTLPEAMADKSAEELKRIFNQVSPPPGWDRQSWFAEREEACAEIWGRRLKRKEPLTSGELAELLSHAEFQTALGSIGDAARLGLLSEEQIQMVLATAGLERNPKMEWLKHELRLRRVANALRVEEGTEVRRGLLDEILHQRRDWALLEVLRHLSDEEIEYCDSALRDRSVLTRVGRAWARDAIRRLRKKRP